MRFSAIFLACAAASVASASDAKTLVYTYQGKPLELVVPGLDEVGKEAKVIEFKSG